MEAKVAPRRKVRSYPRADAIMGRLTLGPVDAQDASLLRLVLDFRQRFKLSTNIDPNEHLSTRWKAARYEGRIVAVFGERDLDASTIEVTDAYAEETRIGKIASAWVFLAYKALHESGKIGRLVFTVLIENRAMLLAVVRETGQLPMSVRFVLEGKNG